MVLVLDDMHNGTEVTVQGICMEMIERMSAWGLCVTPPDADRMPGKRETNEMWRKWARWGLFDFHTHSMPHPVCYAAAFDPDAFKRASYAVIGDAGVKLRAHSWFSSAIVEDGVIKGVVCETKEGRQAILGDVVIDATATSTSRRAPARNSRKAPSSSPPSRAGAASTPTVPRLSSSTTPRSSPRSTTKPSASSAAAGISGG
jgi:hypothetical protein